MDAETRKRLKELQDQRARKRIRLDRARQAAETSAAKRKAVKA